MYTPTFKVARWSASIALIRLSGHLSMRGSLHTMITSHRFRRWVAQEWHFQCRSAHGQQACVSASGVLRGMTYHMAICEDRLHGV